MITDGVVVECGESVKAKEIAEAILLLASPRASYVTGTTLAVDDGGSFH